MKIYLHIQTHYDHTNFTVKYDIHYFFFSKVGNMEMSSSAFFSSLNYKNLFPFNLKKEFFLSRGTLSAKLDTSALLKT